LRARARAWKPLLDPPRGVEETILYPLTFYRLRIRVKRLLGEPRILALTVMVDRVRAKGFIADGFPETVEVEGTLMPARVPEEAAERIARRTTLYWLMRRYRIGLAPEVEVEEKLDVYKVFWVVRGPEGRVILDSVTGAEEEA